MDGKGGSTSPAGSSAPMTRGSRSGPWPQAPHPRPRPCARCISTPAAARRRPSPPWLSIGSRAIVGLHWPRGSGGFSAIGPPADTYEW